MTNVNGSLDLAFAENDTFKPLAAKMRPKSLEEYQGQEHILGEGMPLPTAIKQGKVHSIIFWGPPGTGKTTIAEIIANHANADIERVSAVTSGIKEIRQAIENAKQLNIVLQAKITKENIELTFVSGEPENGEALTLDFYHSTQEHKDFTTTLFKDANGIYRAPTNKAIDGKWRLSLHPFNSSWKIQKVVTLPQLSAFEIKP